jgi:hypothetical protein
MNYDQSLIYSIEENLEPYNYIDHQQIYIDKEISAVIIATPRLWATRYICIITDIPKNTENISDANIFFSKLRKKLISKYAKFPFFKELGSFNVVLCEEHIFRMLSKSLSSFVHKTGLHINVMLGIILINKNSFEFVFDSTWGLYYSRKHFKSILKGVKSYCDNQT